MCRMIAFYTVKEPTVGLRFVVLGKQNSKMLENISGKNGNHLVMQVQKYSSECVQNNKTIEILSCIQRIFKNYCSLKERI